MRFFVSEGMRSDGVLFEMLIFGVDADAGWV